MAEELPGRVLLILDFKSILAPRFSDNFIPSLRGKMFQDTHQEPQGLKNLRGLPP